MRCSRGCYRILTFINIMYNSFHYFGISLVITFTMQGLFVPFAPIGSGDPVRVLCLFHNKYTGYNWRIYCWDYWVFHSLYKVGRNGNFVFNGLNNSKKKLPPVGLDLMLQIITGLGVQCVQLLYLICYSTSCLCPCNYWSDCSAV